MDELPDLNPPTSSAAPTSPRCAAARRVWQARVRTDVERPQHQLFDGRASTVADVLQAANTATFTLGTRLLLVTAADAWKAADRDRVADYLSDPVPGVCLALVGETFRKTERLTKLLEKSGQVLRYDLPKRQSDVADWVGPAPRRAARDWARPRPATSSPRWAPTPIFSRTSWPSWPPTRWAGR